MYYSLDEDDGEQTEQNNFGTGLKVYVSQTAIPLRDQQKNHL